MNLSEKKAFFLLQNGNKVDAPLNKKKKKEKSKILHKMQYHCAPKLKLCPTKIQQSLLYTSFLFSGVIDTDLHRHMYKTWYGCICWPFHKFFVKTPYFGAQTTLYCCLSDGIINGSYYSDCRQKRPSMRSLDDRACKKLWDISEKLTGLRSSQSEML